MADKKVPNKGENKDRFKKLILGVLRNNEAKPDPLEDDPTIPEQDFVDELVKEHNKLHPELKIQHEEKKKEVEVNQNVVDKLFSLESQNGNELFDGEILNDFKHLIENFETLPIDVKEIFHECKPKETERADEKACRKNFDEK